MHIGPTDPHKDLTHPHHIELVQGLGVLGIGGVLARLVLALRT
ncbi:hypothetical protein LCGC14_2387240, partial [marine sediment metagenome]